MVMDVSPSVIILPAASPVRQPTQLAGKTITGHGTDVALNAFEQFASKVGLDPKSVTIVPNAGNWKVLIGLLDEHKSDALFGYSSTSTAAIATAGGKVEERLRFFRFRDLVPELYGSALMVSPSCCASSRTSPASWCVWSIVVSWTRCTNRRRPSTCWLRTTRTRAPRSSWAG